MTSPEISVAVASHDRPVRLRWLLNALEQQTLERSRWEVIVAHDSSKPETEDLLNDHPLARAGTLRHLAFAPGPGPAEKRNAAWREARATLVAFTDDDCRPPREWLERLLVAAQRRPGAILQGPVRPDPDEIGLFYATPYARSLFVFPPSHWGETSNIVYPRELLDRIGGFDEALPIAAGEDHDLLLRAQKAGAEYFAAADALTYHAVDTSPLPQRVRSNWRWQHLAYVIKQHPEARENLPLWIFWKRTHVWLPLAAAAGVLARRRPLAAALAIPWVVHTMPQHGHGARGRLRSLSELPGRALIDASEFAALAYGSVRYRTLFL